MWPKYFLVMLADNGTMIPSAPPALLHKLRTVERQQLLSASSSQPVPSPCVSVCRMDEAGRYCLGCLRTLDELRIWGSSDDADKRMIWQRIQERCNPTP